MMAKLHFLYPLYAAEGVVLTSVSKNFFGILEREHP
jgi:hypothetical protein